MTKITVGGQKVEPLPDPQVDGGGRLDSNRVQADISRTFELTRDYYKYSIGVATALLAFTSSFPSSLTRIDFPQLILVAWIALGIAILCGITLHYT